MIRKTRIEITVYLCDCGEWFFLDEDEAVYNHFQECELAKILEYDWVEDWKAFWKEVKKE